MKTLITGGGFIGAALAQELLRGGHSVSIFGIAPTIIEGTTFVAGDIRDSVSLTRAASDAEVFFHLAGVLGTDYLCDKSIEAVQINLIGAINVFDVARSTGSKVINVGLIPDWDNSYMITKKAAMKMGRMYHKEFGTNITTLEVSHVYGVGQRVEPYRKAIPTFIMRALKDEPLEIYGSGNKQMDCVYVSDLAKALRIAGESSVLRGGRVFAITGGFTTTVSALAKKVINMIGSQSSLRYFPMRPGEPDSDDLDAEHAPSFRDLFDWHPGIDLQSGLTATIAWYRSAYRASTGALVSDLTRS